MGEGYWERQRRYLNEDHAARRKESRRTIGLIKSKERIDRLTEAIESARADKPQPQPQPESEPEPTEFSAEFRRLGVEWITKKTAVIAEIDDNPFLPDETRSAWRGMLTAATLTDSDDTPLTDLWWKISLDTMKFDGRLGRAGSLVALAGSIGTLIEIRTRARAEMSR